MTGVAQIKVFEVAKLQYSSFLRLSTGGAGDHCLLPLSSPGQAPSLRASVPASVG